MKDGARSTLAICDACKQPDHHLERDHRIPKSRDGTNDPRNLHMLCRTCHHRKSALERAFPCWIASNASEWSEWFDLAFPRPTLRSALAYANEWAAEP